MICNPNVVLDGKNFKLPNTVCCFTPNVIYSAICKHCSEFYIGHTDQMFRQRINGHRYSFNTGKENSSALSYHIKSRHNGLLSERIHNFDLCILEYVNCPSRLLRREQFYIDITRANLIGINRSDAIRKNLVSQ